MTIDIGQLLVVGVGLVVSWLLGRLGKTVTNAFKNAARVPAIEEKLESNQKSLNRLFGLTDKHDTRLTIIETRHNVTLEQTAQQEA